MTAIIASCNSVKYSSKLAYVFETTTPFLQPVTDGQYNSLIIWTKWRLWRRMQTMRL